MRLDISGLSGDTKTLRQLNFDLDEHQDSSGRTSLETLIVFVSPHPAVLPPHEEPVLIKGDCTCSILLWPVGPVLMQNPSTRRLPRSDNKSYLRHKHVRTKSLS